ncbi:ribonuclease HII [Candidatus Parcubacteria bacterium]|nr:ribonuclease HII [Candidatus Parcubacteria bacterium]
MQSVVGIDEAGRGPLAGPVAVGAVRVKNQDKFNKFIRGVKDSKKLGPEERNLWFQLAIEARKKGELDFAVSLVSEKVIDKHGISYAIRLGIKRCLEKLNVPNNSQIFLDGALKADSKFKHQLTVIKGDEKIPIISLSSICAKVVRDKKMVRLAKKYPQYDFDLHKGYGTYVHRRAILKYGLTELHRRSFLGKLVKV